jgi:hypothetical protein
MGEAASLRVLSDEQAAAFDRVCEMIVPGSTAAGPVVYADAVLAGMPAPVRDGFVAAIEELGEVAHGGHDALAERAATPAFLGLRALAIEAYYSDFVAAGSDAAGAWAEIGFHPPVARALRKDWSYLGIGA